MRLFKEFIHLHLKKNKNNQVNLYWASAHFWRGTFLRGKENHMEFSGWLIEHQTDEFQGYFESSLINYVLLAMGKYFNWLI